MTSSDLRRRLRDAEIPDEHGAHERGWRVVRAGFEERRPVRHAAPITSRLAIALGTAGLILALVLTPAGAKVVDLVQDVVPGGKPARPLTSLPAPGQLLVESAQGPWVLNEDGSQRLLGDYREATWSPHGYFVAATTPTQLIAVEPDGTPHWSLQRPNPVDPRWAPSGYRIAYRTGSSMRVVAGDGTGDHLLDRHVAPRPPAWRPVPFPEAKMSPNGTGTHVLALVKPDGRVEVIDADSRDVYWRSAPGRVPTELDWSANGSRLVALTGSTLRVFGAKGDVLLTEHLAPGFQATSGEFAPVGTTFAVVGKAVAGYQSRGAVFIVDLGISTAEPKRLLPGLPGGFDPVSWSPDGRWLLIAWRDANEWLFIRPEQPGRIKTAGDISGQFDPGARGRSGFPRLAGWCCTVSGASSP